MFADANAVNFNQNIYWEQREMQNTIKLNLIKLSMS